MYYKEYIFLRDKTRREKKKKQGARALVLSLKNMFYKEYIFFRDKTSGKKRKNKEGANAPPPPFLKQPRYII